MSFKFSSLFKRSVFMICAFACTQVSAQEPVYLNSSNPQTNWHVAFVPQALVKFIQKKILPKKCFGVMALCQRVA